MIKACLTTASHTVSISHIFRSYAHVHGTPGAFSHQTIHHKVYSVPGANSLWHHYGQHGQSQCLTSVINDTHVLLGLIRYKIIIHCFIDGKACKVVGIGVHNNNCATTVLGLFYQAIAKFRILSRVRGDYGSETVLIANFMEEQRNPDRGFQDRTLSGHTIAETATRSRKVVGPLQVIHAC